MKLATCKDCEKEFPLTDEYFYKSPSTNTGYFYRCKECYRERNNERRRKQRRPFIQEHARQRLAVDIEEYLQEVAAWKLRTTQRLMLTKHEPPLTFSGLIQFRPRTRSYAWRAQ